MTKSDYFNWTPDWETYIGHYVGSLKNQILCEMKDVSN